MKKTKFHAVFLLVTCIVFWKFYLAAKSSSNHEKEIFDPSYIILLKGNSLPLYGAVQSSQAFVGAPTVYSTNETVREAKTLIPVPRGTTTYEPTQGFHMRFWFDICKDDLGSLLYHPLFPHLPQMERYMDELFVERIEPRTGIYIFGKLNPSVSGLYRFRVSSSNVRFQIWLSESADPLQSTKLISDVEISKKVNLNSKGGHYVGIAIKSGDFVGKLSLNWQLPGKTDFTVIKTDYFESYRRDDAYYKFFNNKFHLSNMYFSVENQRRSKIYTWVHLPEKVTLNLFPTCPYEPSYLIKEKLPEFGGKWETHYSSIYPEDETDVPIFYPGFKKAHIMYGNPILEQSLAENIVDHVMNAIQSEHKEYRLQNVLSVEENKDEIKGDRYLVELELVDDKNDRYRFSEYVYKPKDSDQLCYPDKFSWNKTAEVNLIITAAGQSHWLIHFINTVSRIYEETKDENFSVTIVDFDVQDTGVIAALELSPLKKYTLLKRKGRFHKTLAINDAAASANKDAIVMQVDLHLVIPSDFIDNVRKHTIEGRMAYSPILNRLQCGSTEQQPSGYWEKLGYGIFGIYKSDWDHIGGMNARGFKDEWGGEDWELLDSTLNNGYEVERLKIKNFYHFHHSKKKMWDSFA